MVASQIWLGGGIGKNLVGGGGTRPRWTPTGSPMGSMGLINGLVGFFF